MVVVLSILFGLAWWWKAEWERVRMRIMYKCGELRVNSNIIKACVCVVCMYLCMYVWVVSWCVYLYYVWIYLVFGEALHFPIVFSNILVLVELAVYELGFISLCTNHDLPLLTKFIVTHSPPSSSFHFASSSSYFTVHCS